MMPVVWLASVKVTYLNDNYVALTRFAYSSVKYEKNISILKY